MLFLLGRMDTASRVREVAGACVAQVPLLKHAVIIGMPMPPIVRHLAKKCFSNDLGAYAMCLNHWIPLPFPVVLLNRFWFDSQNLLDKQYAWDAQCNYHPLLVDGTAYIVPHELGHYVWRKLGEGERMGWTKFCDAYSGQVPSGYAKVSPEECFCEALSVYLMTGDAEKNIFVAQAGYVVNLTK